MDAPSAKHEASHFLHEVWQILKANLLAALVYVLAAGGLWLIERVRPDMKHYAECFDKLLFYVIIPVHALYVLYRIGRHIYLDIRRDAVALAVPPPPAPPAPAPAKPTPAPTCIAEPPAPVETFVGREELIGRLCQLLREHRIVTLYGLGGVGKSEVAKAVAREAARQNWPSEGVCYADLQSATDAHGAAAEIQVRLGLDPVATPADLAHSLRADRLHILDDLFLAQANDPAGVRALVRALHEHGGAARFLLTSREAIGVPGIEHAEPVPVLTAAHADTLFRTEARLCGYEWRAGDDERCGELLAELGGWPLAIVLAARQLDAYSLDTLLSQWRGRRTAALEMPAAQHRSDSIEISLLLSYENLPPSDSGPAARPEHSSRALFRLFADLPGGATSALLTEVLDDRAMPAAAVLVRSRLVEVAGDRYTMLTPVRDFAARREEPDITALRARLDGSLLSLARQWCGDEATWVPRTAEAVAVLSAELPNLHAALERAAADQNRKYVADLTEALRRFYPFAMPGPEAVRRLGAGAEAARSLHDPRGEARCIRSLGDVHLQLADYDQAETKYQEALGLCRSIADRPDEANCLRGLGDVYLQRGGYDQAHQHYEAALEICEAAGDRLGQANSIRSLGDVHRMRAEYDQARGRYEEALPIYASIGARLGEANCIASLGDVHRLRHEYDDARRRYEEALPIYASVGARLGEANCMMSLGDMHRLQAEYDRARARYEEAWPIYRSIGARPGEANCIQSLGDVHAMVGEHAEAAARYHEAEALLEVIGARYSLAGCWQRMAYLAKAEGQTEQAIELMERACGMLEACGVGMWAESCRTEVEEWRHENPGSNTTETEVGDRA
ncbi:MAG: tetratricopeptide repeat protein [Armatimonadetes bacterium]|nr:tetratricopeptide repeat protein [Armatimonadota bacterium]